MYSISLTALSTPDLDFTRLDFLKNFPDSILDLTRLDLVEDVYSSGELAHACIAVVLGALLAISVNFHPKVSK